MSEPSSASAAGSRTASSPTPRSPTVWAWDGGVVDREGDRKPGDAGEPRRVEMPGPKALPRGEQRPGKVSLPELPMTGPALVVTASYPGAGARVVEETVAAPIEKEVQG